jgi:hypothetical protein
VRDTDRCRQLRTGISPLWPTGIVPLWLQPRQADDESVYRASDSFPAAVQDVGVNHRGAHIAVSQEFLHGPDVVCIFQQMRGEKVA